MTDPVFDAAVATVLLHEGSTVANDPNDAGGLSRFGISSKQYPTLDIANLTAEKAKAIYFTDYFLKYRIGQLPGVRIPVKVMDSAVLAGPGTAIMTLQRAINACGGRVKVDGVIGRETCDACRSANTDALLAMYRELLVSHYEQIVADNPNDARFFNNWRARALA